MPPAPVLGYRSLYHGLLVNGALESHGNYTVDGQIKDDYGVDMDSIEFRLDNEKLDNSLFDINSRHGPGDTTVVTFELKDNERIDIYDRWFDTPQSRLLSMHDLVYGVHNLRVMAKDMFGKTGNKVVVFNFDHGDAFTVDTTHKVTIIPSLPLISPGTSAEEQACIERIKERLDHSLTIPDQKNVGIYSLKVLENGALNVLDFGITESDLVGTSRIFSYSPHDLSGKGDFDKFQQLAFGAKPDFSIQGLVGIMLAGERAYVGGAIEQMSMYKDKEFKAGSRMPKNFTEGYRIVAEASDGAMTITEGTYTMESSDDVESLPLLPLLQPASDTFKQGGPITVANAVGITRYEKVMVYPPLTPGGGSIIGGGGGSGGGGGWSVAGTGGGAGGSGPGTTSGTPGVNPVERTATLSPTEATVPVGGSATFHLTVTPGSYGPTCAVEGYTEAGEFIEITGDLAAVQQTGSATLTGRFPGIWGSPAQKYLKNSSDYDPDFGYYYYDMKYCHDLDFYVEGVAFGQNKADLSFDDLEYNFLPVSDPYADVAVDERTLVIEPKITGAQSSDDTLSFDVLVRDPVAAYAEDPAAFPIKAELNNVAIPSADITYLAGYELPGTYKISLKKKPIKCGVNEFHFKIVSSAGIITRFTYIVEIGDEDKLSPDCPLNQKLVCNPTPGCVTYTKNDRYIISYNSNIQAIGAPEFHPLYIFGEFNNVRSKTITGAGAMNSSITLNRISRFGRFTRPFLVIDDYPAEGAISVPSGSGGAPIAVQKPGGIVRWTVGSQSAATYVEGVSIIWDGKPTHLLPGPVDPPQTFSLEAYVSNERDAGAEKKFSVQLFSAAGAPVELGTGVGEILLDAQDQGSAFGGKGKKYGFAGPIEIVRSLPNGARWSDEGGRYKIVPELGGYVAVRFAGLRTRAVVSLRAEFIDVKPDYALGEDEETALDDSDNDSDNFFLRENGASGNPDSQDLDIYYRILPAGVNISGVKIKIYKGDTSAIVATLDGEKDASGAYKTGDNLHIQWTPILFDQDSDPGFYRCQLQVYAGGSSTPICETSIGDADTSTDGWQCPQDCLGIHDLAWKHRPSVFVHADEFSGPAAVSLMMDYADLVHDNWAGVEVSPPDATAPVALTDLSSNDSTDYYLRFRDATRDVDRRRSPGSGISIMYHHGDPQATFAYVQYWHFEPSSSGVTPLNFGSDDPTYNHEGDWEMCQVAVRLAAPAPDGNDKVQWIKPFSATASQHYRGQTVQWASDPSLNGPGDRDQDFVGKTATCRPNVYIARETHATYFSPNMWFRFSYFGGDGLLSYEDAPTAANPDDLTGNTAFSYSLELLTDTMVADWEGTWGTRDGIDGPRSPAFREGSGVIMYTNPRRFNNHYLKSGIDDASDASFIP